MTLRKYRWSKHYESAEEELVELLAAKHIDATRWTADGYEEFPAIKLPRDRQLWCAEGSLAFTINGKEISIQTGDTLEIPANTIHGAIAGFSGCVCYEYPASATSPQG